ncbi:MAG: DNA mismatch repair endonuclease MutL [Chloroflexi bacterium]|nr:DNA mismatch repair endonuclease MutL [Chloroflexota bacterium]
MTIRILPPDVAAKIAAGEVVERPASVVKELVENAIDAGAKTIRVEIQSGGKRLIRVMDDGSGIPAEEVPLAFARHATSKLASVEDLSRVTTLGFRGEALASVAAVSQLTLVSRPAAQAAATRIRLEGGQQVSLGVAGSPGGTIITVENLFYNVPARLKFLKADATEAAHIHRIVSHYALAYPHIRFALQSDNRLTFQTNGSGDLFDALAAVFDLDTARQMILVEYGEAGEQRRRGAEAQGSGLRPEPVEGGAGEKINLSVQGYVGAPALHRGARDQIIFFVNRRWIQDRSLNQAVVQAYHTFLPVGRFPVAVLNIELDPAEVDVNVHPTKAEVKFRDPREVFKMVQKGVRAAVAAAAPVPAYGGHAAAAYSFPGDFGGHAGDTAPWRTSFGGHGSPGFSQFGFEAQRTLPLPPTSGGEGERQSLIESSAPQAMPLMRVVGQIQQMYIVTEGPDGLYLIDQHAAHERILYEKLAAQKAQAAVARQQLLEPVVVELSPGHAALLEAELAALTEVGFELEPFGGATYRIRAIPEMLSKADPARALVDILAEMADGAIPLARETHEKIAITVCKRASIKGGQILSPEEMRELVRQLEATSAPRTCPHGRPTMIHLSTAQLAREFGRM